MATLGNPPAAGRRAGQTSVLFNEVEGSGRRGICVGLANRVREEPGCEGHKACMGERTRPAGHQGSTDRGAEVTRNSPRRWTSTSKCIFHICCPAKTQAPKYIQLRGLEQQSLLPAAARRNNYPPGLCSSALPTHTCGLKHNALWHL